MVRAEDVILEGNPEGTLSALIEQSLEPAGRERFRVNPGPAVRLKRFFVRRIVFPGAEHFWASDPFDSEPCSYAAQAIPQMMRFLESSL